MLVADLMTGRAGDKYGLAQKPKPPHIRAHQCEVLMQQFLKGEVPLSEQVHRNLAAEYIFLMSNDLYIKCPSHFVYAKVVPKPKLLVDGPTGHDASIGADDIAIQYVTTIFAFRGKDVDPLTLASTIPFDTAHEAMALLDDYHAIPLIGDNGQASYPFYDERKGKLKSEARDRRRIREDKAVEVLNTAADVAFKLGGL